MVGLEKGNCWFIFEADKRCNLNFWYWNLKKNEKYENNRSQKPAGLVFNRR
jgi:hypothetical protein